MGWQGGLDVRQYGGLGEGMLGKVRGESWLLQRRHQYSGRVTDNTASGWTADAAGVGATAICSDSWQDKLPGRAVRQGLGFTVPLVAEVVTAMGHNYQPHLFTWLYSDLWLWLCEDLRSVCFPRLWPNYGRMRGHATLSTTGNVN